MYMTILKQSIIMHMRVGTNTRHKASAQNILAGQVHVTPSSRFASKYNTVKKITHHWFLYMSAVFILFFFQFLLARFESLLSSDIKKCNHLSFFSFLQDERHGWHFMQGKLNQLHVLKKGYISHIDMHIWPNCPQLPAHCFFFFFCSSVHS